MRTHLPCRSCCDEIAIRKFSQSRDIAAQGEKAFEQFEGHRIVTSKIDSALTVFCGWHSHLTRTEMDHRRNSSTSSSHSLYNNDSSISSVSPLNSPMVSPLNSPYESPGGSPREQLHNSFASNLSLQPPSSQSSKSSSSNTFVHKLYKYALGR